MIDSIKLILQNAVIITLAFAILFALLEFYRVRDAITTFQNVFKPKYLQTYLAVFVSALILQIVIFPLIKLLF